MLHEKVIFKSPYLHNIKEIVLILSISIYQSLHHPLCLGLLEKGLLEREANSRIYDKHRYALLISLTEPAAVRC